MRDNHGRERGQPSLFLASLLTELQLELTTLRDEFGLPDMTAGELPVGL